MKLDQIFPSDSLKASDLQGDSTAVISTYEIKDFDDGPKLVLHFQGTDKTLICNKTNANTIADMYGNDVDNWVSKPITLFPTQTDFQGKQVACIRVRIGGPDKAGPTNVQARTAADMAAEAQHDQGSPF